MRHRQIVRSSTTVLFAAALAFASLPAPAALAHGGASTCGVSSTSHHGGRGVCAGSPTLLASGLSGGSGSTIGPDGALYVTEGAAGEVSRIDLGTGAVSVVASGLPPSIVGIGGAMDVAFLDGRLYVLVTLVGADVGGSSVVGIYRVDSPTTFTVVADIGAWAIDNPPPTDFMIPTGVQYAIEAYRGGFLVTDGHHNRLLKVSLDGDVTAAATFGNIVPTGLAIRRHTIFMAEAGPVPHLPENGRIVALSPKTSVATQVAAGGRLLVDVEFGTGNRLYALAQGVFPVGNEPGSPAMPDTGQLLTVNGDGTFSVLVSGLDRPTSLEIVGHTAYVVTLPGNVWSIDVSRHCSN
ncbi:MAG: ScyD/ScyE family protein [Frankiales bacterium]|nr:ScyD/ScyE family protein [Frankiales bacterium]